MLIEVHYHYESDFKAHILDLSRYKGAYILNGLPKILNHNILFIEPDIVQNPTLTDIETEKVNVTWDAPDGLADDYTVTSASLEGWNSKHTTPCTEGNAVGGTRWRTVCGLHPGVSTDLQSQQAVVVLVACQLQQMSSQVYTLHASGISRCGEGYILPRCKKYN